MTHALALLALTAASSAIQRAHTTLVAIGAPEAARYAHQAGELIAQAVGALVVDKAKRMGASQTEAS